MEQNLNGGSTNDKYVMLHISSNVGFCISGCLILMLLNGADVRPDNMLVFIILTLFVVGLAAYIPTLFFIIKYKNEMKEEMSAYKMRTGKAWSMYPNDIISLLIALPPILLAYFLFFASSY